MTTYSCHYMWLGLKRLSTPTVCTQACGGDWSLVLGTYRRTRKLTVALLLTVSGHYAGLVATFSQPDKLSVQLEKKWHIVHNVNQQRNGRMSYDHVGQYSIDNQNEGQTSCDVILSFQLLERQNESQTFCYFICPFQPLERRTSCSMPVSLSLHVHSSL